jgi:phage/plasmid-like protein (TIGR03299 family)
MAHELATTANRIAMAYVGQTPWHGLGQALTADASIDTWVKEAGLDYRIQRSKVRFASTAGDVAGAHEWPDHHVLFRSDTKAPLGMVSASYKVVQPRAVVEFFRELAEQQGAKLETAGALFGGTRYWALARLNGAEENIVGDDIVRGYLLVSTSADGSKATEVRETAIRVVCNNTISIAQGERSKHVVRVTHRSTFDPLAAQAKLEGTEGNFAAFVKTARALAKVKMTKLAAQDFVAGLLSRGSIRDDVTGTAGYTRIMGLFDGAAIGGSMPGVREGTAWGLLNSITEHVDHYSRARSQDNRLASAWDGQGAEMKSYALAELAKLAA